MAALPYFKLYSADYLTDTMHLSTEEHGAFFLLLMNYSQTGKPLNNANERLAFVARLSSDRWLEIKGVLAEFFRIDGDEWTNKRMEFELESVLTKSTRAAYAGKESARKRANVRLSAKGNTKATEVQQKFNGRCVSVEQESNHTDTDTDTDKKDIAHSTNDAFDQFWKIYPKKKSKAAARKSFDKAIKRATIEVLLSGVSQLVKESTDPQFVPYPATWLTNEGWLDESNPKVKVEGSTRIPGRFTAIDAQEKKPPSKSTQELINALRGVKTG